MTYLGPTGDVAARPASGKHHQNKRCLAEGNMQYSMTQQSGSGFCVALQSANNLPSAGNKHPSHWCSGFANLQQSLEGSKLPVA